MSCPSSSLLYTHRLVSSAIARVTMRRQVSWDENEHTTRYDKENEDMMENEKYFKVFQNQQNFNIVRSYADMVRASISTSTSTSTSTTSPLPGPLPLPTAHSVTTPTHTTTCSNNNNNHNNNHWMLSSRHNSSIHYHHYTSPSSLSYVDPHIESFYTHGHRQRFSALFRTNYRKVLPWSRHIRKSRRNNIKWNTWKFFTANISYVYENLQTIQQRRATRHRMNNLNGDDPQQNNVNTQRFIASPYGDDSMKKKRRQLYPTTKPTKQQMRPHRYKQTNHITNNTCNTNDDEHEQSDSDSVKTVENSSKSYQLNNLYKNFKYDHTSSLSRRWQLYLFKRSHRLRAAKQRVIKHILIASLKKKKRDMNSRSNKKAFARSNFAVSKYMENDTQANKSNSSSKTASSSASSSSTTSSTSSSTATTVSPSTVSKQKSSSPPAFHTHTNFSSFRQTFYHYHRRAIEDALDSTSYRVTGVRLCPITVCAQTRFMDALHQHMSCPRLTFHGSRHSNMQSICDRGLLIPGDRNGVAVANGSAYGVGIYTATDASISTGYSSGCSTMFVCAAITEVEKGLHERIKHAEQKGLSPPFQPVKICNNSFVILFEEKRVIPLFLLDYEPKHRSVERLPKRNDRHYMGLAATHRIIKKNNQTVRTNQREHANSQWSTPAA